MDDLEKTVISEKTEKVELGKNLVMNLSASEITLLRTSVLELGLKDKNAVLLQLKIANAILDSTY